MYGFTANSVFAGRIIGSGVGTIIAMIGVGRKEND